MEGRSLTCRFDRSRSRRAASNSCQCWLNLRPLSALRIAVIDGKSNRDLSFCATRGYSGAILTHARACGVCCGRLFSGAWRYDGTLEYGGLLAG